MPFYWTGRVRKDPISEADVEVVLDLLDEVQPTNIFVAGDSLSKADLDRKVEALHKHGSQKDRAMFPGAYDEREF